MGGGGEGLLEPWGRGLPPTPVSSLSEECLVSVGAQHRIVA